jgi:hypothetical protein
MPSDSPAAAASVRYKCTDINTKKTLKPPSQKKKERKTT